MAQKTNTVFKTLKLRVRDKHAPVLNALAFATNQIWNEVNERTWDAYNEPVPGVGWIKGVWLTAFDLAKEVKNIRYDRDLDIPAASVQEITEVHAKTRNQFKKSKLHWRSSGGARRALGWVPFKSGQLTYRQGQVKFAGHFFKVWDSYGLANFDFRSGSFSQDARGRWYLNIVVQEEIKTSKGTGEIGIDLGLKTTASCSNGVVLERKQFYRNAEKSLSVAQRANKKKQIKNIHAKIKNKRADTNHKFSTELVKNNALIVVGNVSSSGLAKTKMAKSVLDAGWFQLKQQLDYKSKRMQVAYIEINESYTTQTCSSCGCISASSPKGMDGLGIREWICAECGASHDRDINAAKNILALGHERLAVGIPTL